MRNAHKFLVPLLFTAVASLSVGCVSTKSYVDPAYGRATYNDITRKTDPYTWKIVVEFQRNGKHLPAIDSELMGHVERTVRASGMATPMPEGGMGQLKVMVNNVADMGTAGAKGFGTGLTLGLVGSTVSDNYEMEAELSMNGKVIRRSGYKHALHSTVGNASGPQGLEPMTPSAAFGRVVEQLMLNFLKDIQQSGDLSLVVPEWLHILPEPIEVWPS